MIIFGLLTIYNTTQLRVIPQIMVRYRRTEGQLARMLFLQVAIYIILNMPLCLLYLMLVLPTEYVSTMEFFYALTITPFFFHFSYATTFFLYILSARVYSEELFRLISICRFRVRIQPVSGTHHPHATGIPLVNNDLQKSNM